MDAKILTKYIDKMIEDSIVILDIGKRFKEFFPEAEGLEKDLFALHDFFMISLGSNALDSQKALDELIDVRSEIEALKVKLMIHIKALRNGYQK